MTRSFLVLAALLFSVSSLSAQTIIGRASVTDGDTLEIRGSRIRLHGVDAPESGQLCEARDGKAYRCGQQAALALADKIGSSNVTCRQKDVDRYGRVVAQCSANGVDLNGWLVEQGYALAYRQYGTDYVSEEDQARQAKRGLWAGSFTPPWDWRRGSRDTKAPQRAQPPRTTPAPGKGECRIKGNINRKGDKIYHLPGSNSYDQTVVDLSQGERWFCSIEDAVAAGWRAPTR